jgi:hypothetical protein
MKTPYHSLFTCLMLAMSSCKARSSPAPSASATPAHSAPAGASAGTSQYIPHPRTFPIPTGPVLGIFAGEGVGPIRFGATVQTIERHMHAPCEVLEKDKCRYIGRGVEFDLKDGVVSGIFVHRHDRPAGKDRQGQDRVYGIFNGGIPPDLRFGMLPWAIQEYLGKPKRVEKVAGANPFHTEERHYYDGLMIEYDRLPNGNLVLGGAQVLKK